VLKKRLIIAIKIFIALIVFGWVGWELYKSWGKIQQIHWAPNYFLLILSGICYAVAYVPAAMYWRYAMRTLGQETGLYETFRAYYIGHLGKYVPGKVMVLIIRTGLLNHQRLKKRVVAASIFMETMTMMAVGAFVAAFIMLIWLRDLEQSAWLTYLALGTLAGTVLPILPPIFVFAAKKCSIELEGLSFKTLAVGWLLNIPLWIILGISLWLTMLGFGMESQSILTELPFCTLAISFSVVLGFASMLPGGLGTREAAMLLVLTPFFTTHPVGDIDPAAMALVIVIVQRIISILAELTVSALLAWKRT
jgi:uncharacterized membrane protein YbhN (UPF0104 family)